MKKLVLVLMMALALVSVNAKQKVAHVAAKVDTAVVADTVNAENVNDMKEFEQVMSTLGKTAMQMKGMDPDEQESHWDVVAFAGTITPFLTGIIIVLIVLIFNHRNKKAKYELMAKAIEAGKELPQTFFDEPKSKKAAKTPLQSAFSLMGVGIGLFLMFWFLKGELTLSFIGAIPFMIGLGKFIAYRMEQKSPKANDDDQQVG